MPRTDANGSTESPVAFLGVYPAATRLCRKSVGGKVLNLPLEVERRSFEETSRSGRDLDEHYLKPLGLTREMVYLVDMMPYFLANTAVGKSGRSMAENIRLYDRQQPAGRKLGIEPRAEPDALIDRCRTMRGNRGRLDHLLGSSRAKVLFTMGAEAAACARGFDTEKEGRAVLYAEPARLDVFGLVTTVYHLVHPGLLMRAAKRRNAWVEKHEHWQRETGPRLSSSPPAALGDIIVQLEVHAGRKNPYHVLFPKSDASGEAVLTRDDFVGQLNDHWEMALLDYDGNLETAEPVVSGSLFDPTRATENRAMALAMPLLEYERIKWASREQEYEHRIGCRNLIFSAKAVAVNLEHIPIVELQLVPGGPGTVACRT